jgi:cell division protein FtsB
MSLGGKYLSKKILIALLAFSMLSVGLYSLFGSNGVMEIVRRKKMEKDLQQKLEATKKENITLRSKIWSLKNRDFEVEKIAREQLMMIKAGEKVYIVEEQ